MVEAAVSARPMRRRLAAVWAILLLLVGVISVLEWSERNTSDEGAYANRMLLPAPIEELSAIEIAVAGGVHRFERDRSGIWFYHGVHTGAEGSHEHAIEPDTAQRIAKAFAAFGRTKIEREFAISDQEAAFGTRTPTMIILVYGPGNSAPLMQYAIGDIAPDTISRYVRPVGRSNVVTIPNYQIENLLGLLEAVGGTPAARVQAR
jgi:hypothetical protein